MKIPVDKQYEYLTHHLEYLNEKILGSFSLFIKLATAIIGGIFFLYWRISEKVQYWHKFIVISNILIWLVGISIISLIVVNLLAWKEYRETLSKEYPKIKSTHKLRWWLGEAVMILLILMTCILFSYYNPLNVDKNNGYVLKYLREEAVMSNNFLIFLEGLAISLLLGGIITKNLIHYLRKKHGFQIAYDRSTGLLGYLERFAFTMAIYFNMSAFVGIWLGIKFIGRWSPEGFHVENPDDKKKAPAAINIFLIGNLVSLLFAALGAYIMKGFKF